MNSYFKYVGEDYNLLDVWDEFGEFASEDKVVLKVTDSRTGREASVELNLKAVGLLIQQLQEMV